MHFGGRDFRLRTLDLFCGAGLGSVGAHASGARIVGAIDACPIAISTYRENFPSATVINGRVENVHLNTLRDRIGDIDLLLASPECTNHTCAKGSAPRSEASKATAMQVIRFAKAFGPRWVIVENVVNMRPWPRYAELVGRMEAFGYRVREQVLDSSAFGVPQKRRRLFLICGKETDPPGITPPLAVKRKTVNDILDTDDRWEMTPLFRKGRAKDTIARAKRAISELGNDSGFLIVYYGTDGCGGWQPLDRPLRTVTTVDRFALVRPTEDGHRMRMLQVPELKRAMGLSDSFELPIGTRREKIKLLGNGVCPPVMSSLVAAIRLK